jgi:hypothetical protein
MESLQTHDSSSFGIDQSLVDEAMQLFGQYDGCGDLACFQQDEETLIQNLVKQKETSSHDEENVCVVSVDDLRKTMATPEEIPFERPESATLERATKGASNKRGSSKPSECPPPASFAKRNSKVIVDFDCNEQLGVRLTGIYVHDSVRKGCAVVCLPYTQGLSVYETQGITGKDICGMWELPLSKVHPYKRCDKRFKDGVCLECEGHTGDCYFCIIPDGSMDTQPVLMAEADTYIESKVPFDIDQGKPNAKRYAKDMFHAFTSKVSVYEGFLPISSCNANFVENLFAMYKWRKEEIGKDDFFYFVRRFFTRDCVFKQTPTNCYNSTDEYKLNANGSFYSVINKFHNFKDAPEKVTGYADAWKLVFSSSENPLPSSSMKKKRNRSETASPSPPPKLSSNPFLPMPNGGFV